MKTDLCWDASPVVLCAVVRGGGMAKQGLSGQWQKKKASWFQLCQRTVGGHGQSILPQIFRSLAYSLLPASPLAFCSCRRTLIHLFSVELHLSPLPSTFGSSCRTPLVSLNLLKGTDISLPPVQPVFPVLMLLFQLVQVFPCAVWWCLDEIWDCSSYIYRYSCWTSNSSVSFSAYKTQL